MYADIFKREYVRDAAGKFATTSSSADGWKKVGHALGSNPGGVYEKDGQKYYVKLPHDAGQVHTEVAADKVYELLGVKTLSHKAEQIGGKTASVTKWDDSLKRVDYMTWRKLSPAQKTQAAQIFVASALVKNWDVVGLNYDNVVKDAAGNLAIVDTGGSFTYRAMGHRKSFGNDATPEIASFLSHKKTSGSVFRPLYEDSPDLFRQAAFNLRHVSKADLEKAVKDAPDAAKLVDAMLWRKYTIQKRLGVVLKGGDHVDLFL